VEHTTNWQPHVLTLLLEQRSDTLQKSQFCGVTKNEMTVKMQAE